MNIKAHYLMGYRAICNLIFVNGVSIIRMIALFHTLRSVYLMGPVRFVGLNAFEEADYLVEVGFVQPEVLKRIDARAFYSSDSLTSINLPQNADIAEDAFYSCKKLEKQGCPYCKNPDEL